jgi:hypothetical protein
MKFKNKTIQFNSIQFNSKKIGLFVRNNCKYYDSSILWSGCIKEGIYVVQVLLLDLPRAGIFRKMI